MVKRSYDIEIMGQRLTIRSDKSEEFVNRITRLVDSRMRSLAGASANATPLSAAVLTAMNLAEELLVLEERRGSEFERIARLAQRIERLDLDTAAGQPG